MFKVNNKNSNSVTDVVLVILLLTFNIFHTFYSVSFVDVEQVNVRLVDKSLCQKCLMYHKLLIEHIKSPSNFISCYRQKI